ncbi:MAG: hypothetical protein HY073_00035 [Deltaproteobacteria bacterium]|nr:hypothetical protein [Deltaproteobacteria bacterium]
MRTTIVIDDSLGFKIKSLASRKGLSEFVNQCLREHFEKEERRKRQTLLEKSYLRAAKGKVSKEFDASDIEDWPEW